MCSTSPVLIGTNPGSHKTYVCGYGEPQPNHARLQQHHTRQPRGESTPGFQHVLFFSLTRRFISQYSQSNSTLDSTSQVTAEQHCVPVLLQAQGALGPAAPWGNAPHPTPGACKKAFAIRICGLKETHLQQDGEGWLDPKSCCKDIPHVPLGSVPAPGGRCKPWLPEHLCAELKAEYVITRIQPA